MILPARYLHLFWGFSMAMLNNQMVSWIHLHDFSGSKRVPKCPSAEECLGNAGQAPWAAVWIFSCDTKMWLPIVCLGFEHDIHWKKGEINLQYIGSLGLQTRNISKKITLWLLNAVAAVAAQVLLPSMVGCSTGDKVDSFWSKTVLGTWGYCPDSMELMWFPGETKICSEIC